MANYTPDSPYVLGQEWVPIKDDLYTLDIAEEKGTSFSLSTLSTVVTGRFYVSDPPLYIALEEGTVSQPLNVSSMMSVYPRGLEDQTGPLKSVVVPCNGGSVSGDFFLYFGSSVAESLARVGDSSMIAIAGTTNVSSRLKMFFAFNDFPELSGKRIVNLEWLVSMTATEEFFAPFPNAEVELNYSFYPSVTAETLIAQAPSILSAVGTNFDSVPSVTLPRFNVLWDTIGSAVVPSFPLSTGLTVFPWTYDRLQRLDANSVSADRQSMDLYVRLPVNINPVMIIEYSALRVTYCEEQRVLMGGLAGYISSDSNTVQLRNKSLTAGGAALSPGNYTVTVDGQGNQTEAFAIKELYPMAAQPGITVKSTTRVGSTFSSETTDQIVQLSLHTASAVVPDVHGYGRQVQAPVYTGVTATQEIVSNANGTKDYPWARFYARRFGDTTQPLTLRHATLTSITASITVSEFDALPEIVDGWKEVTLKFTSPTPSFNGAGGLESYQWISSELIGSQWQVLGASAYVKRGTFPLTQITGAQSLDATTYGGSSANLIWAGLNDTTSDATLLFAQEMPAVSGLTVSTASLAVTGIGQDCGINPACIPTGISYNNVTWTPLGTGSIAASGFGYYELQRYDAIDAAWNTIMHGTAPSVTGFHDYEARVGIESRYRIRFQHRLLFPSLWSSEVANTIPAPGLSGNSVGNSAMIFTTNERQNGSSSLGYTMVWDSTPDDAFTFLEAGDVQLQKMYQRDFQIAFRPLERGGERFQRTLVVQGAAVPTGLIRDGFRSLRDLAWEDVSYVCVRNELGDRWYATVLVPSGNVLRNRRLYLAQVDIIEVTDTSSIVILPETS